MKVKARRGLMLVLSSPSGAGKTTLANLLIKSDKHIHPSISYTTRDKRQGEQEAVDYFFVDRPTFLSMVEQNKFLEHAEVFGNYYGTPKDVIEKYLGQGEDVVFDIEWQGNRALTKMAPDDVVSVFILPPSKKVLNERLRNRALDTEESIELRMKKANSELVHWQEYDYVIVNKDLDESLKKLTAILRSERLKKRRRQGIYEFVQQLIKETV